MFLVKH